VGRETLRALQLKNALVMDGRGRCLYD